MSASERTRRRGLPPQLHGVPCFKTEVVAQLRAVMPSDEALDDIKVRFSALTDRSRLKVLYALVGSGELSVCDLAHAVGMGLTSLSPHLRKLRHLGIVTYRTDGEMGYYSLADGVMARVVRQALGRS